MAFHRLQLTFLSYAIALSFGFCPKDGISIANEGSCLFGMEYGDSFEKAQNYCSNYYGNLVSILNPDVNEKVLQLAKMFPSSPKLVWLGGMYNGTKITWIDGSPDEFNNLQQGSAAGNLILNVTSGKWTTANWNGMFPFVCLSQHVSTEAPTCPLYPPCPSDWIYSQSLRFCYKVIFNVDFTTADQNCRLMNSNLTSIHSEEENTFVNDLGKTGTVQSAWPQQPLIGGKRTGPGNREFIWIDGTKMDYMKWSENQPDNAKGNEYCVQVLPDLLSFIDKSEKYLYKWNDFSCEARFRAAICKQAAKY